MSEHANTRCPACGQRVATKQQSTLLSRRQIEVLVQIARGRTNPQIAQMLGISPQTVKNHVSTILHLLCAPDRTAAVVRGLRECWITLPEED